jgi:hypothetical protein
MTKQRPTTRKTKQIGNRRQNILNIYFFFVKQVNYFCGGREKVGKSNNFKNELTMFTP